VRKLKQLTDADYDTRQGGSAVPREQPPQQGGHSSQGSGAEAVLLLEVAARLDERQGRLSELVDCGDELIRPDVQDASTEVPRKERPRAWLARGFTPPESTGQVSEKRAPEQRPEIVNTLLPDRPCGAGHQQALRQSFDHRQVPGILHAATGTRASSQRQAPKPSTKFRSSC
jgi:hypothetical protein